MERYSIIYLILLMSAWTEASEETSTMLIPARRPTDNKTSEPIGPDKDWDKLERPAHSTVHARPVQDTVPIYSEKKVQVAGPDEPPPPHEGTERPGDVIPPSKQVQDAEPANSKSANETNKIITDMAHAMTASDPDIPKEKPLHPVEHARQPQDTRPLYSADKQVQVAAPATPQDSAAHNATEKPKDVMTPGMSDQDTISTRLILKRESSNSSSNLNDSSSTTSTKAPAKRDLSGDDFPPEINPETLKSSKREIQNVANILISSTKHIHNDKKDRTPQPQTSVEEPKCPSLSEFINGTQSLWNGLQTSDGVQGGLFSIFSAMSESVVVLAQCGLKLLNELGLFLNPSNNLDNKTNDKQETKIGGNTDPGDKIVGVITVTEDPFKGDSEPLITLVPTVDNDDVEPAEKNLVNLDVDVSLIPKSNTKPNANLPLSGFGGTNPSNTLIVETNVSKTDLVDLSQPGPVVIESNFPKTQVVNEGSPKPANVESNIPNIIIVDTDQPRPANVDTNIPNSNQPVNMVVMDTNLLKPVTESAPTKSPNVFTVNVFSINKDQREKYFPSVLTHKDKVQTDNVADLSDYDYGDYSIEDVNGPEDMKKKKRAGKGNRRWRKRTAKKVDKDEKKP